MNLVLLGYAALTFRVRCGHDTRITRDWVKWSKGQGGQQSTVRRCLA